MEKQPKKRDVMFFICHPSGMVIISIPIHEGLKFENGSISTRQCM